MIELEQSQTRTVSLEQHEQNVRDQIERLIKAESLDYAWKAREPISKLGAEGIEILVSIIQEESKKRRRRAGDAFDNVAIVAKSRFQIAILKAFEQIGDAHTLDAVRAVANENPKTFVRERVIEAAIACLPYLEERVGREEKNNRLLRPAKSSDKPDESLLRPAVGTPNDSDQLLHVADHNFKPI